MIYHFWRNILKKVKSKKDKDYGFQDGKAKGSEGTEANSIVGCCDKLFTCMCITKSHVLYSI